jgi:hypothetical protein
MSAASEAAKVVGELQQAKSGLAQAGGKTAEAIEGARRAGQQFAELGYRRVHAEMEGIRRRLEQTRQVLAEAGQGLEAGIGHAGGVTDELTPEDADKLWAATASQVDQTLGLLQRIDREVKNVERDIATVMRGAKPEYLLSLMAGIKQGLQHAGQNGLKAKATTQAAAARGQEVSGTSGN